MSGLTCFYQGKERIREAMKTVTAQAVSRTLGTQFKRSETGTTRIRGWHYFTAGFEVIQSGFKAIVRYQASSDRNRQPVDLDSLMNEYTTLLASKGYTVTQMTYWGSPAIVVSRDN
jgi:hypothetical protein